MRGALIAVSALALMAGVATPAAAADFFEPGVVTVDEPRGFDGFYAGVQLGGAWIGGEIFDNNYSNNGGWNPAESSSGFLLGAQIGYNFPISDMFVFGIEASAKAIFAEDTICSLAEGCGDALTGDNPAVAFNLNGLGAINARFGFNVADNVLLYVLAGPAVASVTTHHWDNTEFDGSNRLFGGWDVGNGLRQHVARRRGALL
jgi:opacity protein-like surface antigen